MAVAAAPGTAIAAATFPAPMADGQRFPVADRQPDAPPPRANCTSVGRRCFTPTSMRNSYNLGPLYAAGNEGQGVTIAIIELVRRPEHIAFRPECVQHTAMGLPHMCGEPGGHLRERWADVPARVLERQYRREGPAARIQRDR